MILHVARHGQTRYNAQGRYAGSTDVPLDEIGFSQAEELLKLVREEGYDRIVSSALLRARQTAEVVSAGLGLPFGVMKEFNERNVGVYEGLTREEAKLRYPKPFEQNITRQVDAAPPGGETIFELARRVDGGIDNLKALHGGEKILLVCHGFVAREINRYIEGLAFEEMHWFSLGNCHLAKYELG